MSNVSSRPFSFLEGVNGSPAFVAEFSLGLVTLLYNIFIVRSGLGEQSLAAFMLIGYAALICITALLGASQGIQPVISYLSGAGEYGKIRKLFAYMAVFIAALSFVFYGTIFFFGSSFFSIFIQNNEILLSPIMDIARIYFINLIPAGLSILIISFLQSMEHPIKSLIISLSRSTLPLITVFGWQ